MRLAYLLAFVHLFFFLANSNHAGARIKQLDLTGAAAVANFAEDKLRYDLVFKSRYSNFSGRGKLGLILYADFHYHLLLPSLGVAAAWRFGDQAYFDIGAGLYSLAWQPGPLITWSIGWHLGNNFYLSFPFNLELFHVNWAIVRWGPFFGYRF